MRNVTGASTLVLCLAAGAAFADTTPQTLPFSQDWTNIGLITANDNWSGVPGIQGFRGDGITGGHRAPTRRRCWRRTTLASSTSTPTRRRGTITNGGVAEFELTNPTVGMQGSGTADAPYVKLYLNTTGQTGVTVAYNLRDLDSSADNAVQAVALHFRVGSTGTFTNVPAAFVADATTAEPATLVTPVCAVLPVAAENQAVVEVRVMTSNAVGNDENVGVDDIVVSTAPLRRAGA